MPKGPSMHSDSQDGPTSQPNNGALSGLTHHRSGLQEATLYSHPVTLSPPVSTQTRSSSPAYTPAPAQPSFSPFVSQTLCPADPHGVQPMQLMRPMHQAGLLDSAAEQVCSIFAKATSLCENTYCFPCFCQQVEVNLGRSVFKKILHV